MLSPLEELINKYQQPLLLASAPECASAQVGLQFIQPCSLSLLIRNNPVMHLCALYRGVHLCLQLPKMVIQRGTLCVALAHLSPGGDQCSTTLLAPPCSWSACWPWRRRTLLMTRARRARRHAGPLAPARYICTNSC